MKPKVCPHFHSPSAADTYALLSIIYQGCDIAIDSLHRMASETSKIRTKDLLLDLAHEHRKIMFQAAQRLRPYHMAPREVSPWIRAMLDRCTRFIGGSRYTKRRIAGILNTGARRGYKTIFCYLHEHPAARHSAQMLAGELMQLQRRALRESSQLME